MPYKDKEKKRAWDRERYRRMKVGGERPGNPLTPDEWCTLQRVAYDAGTWAGERVDKLAQALGVKPYRER
jgi:hypothetical protein